MLGEKELIHEIEVLFSEKLLLDVNSPDIDLVETGALDSLTLVELMLQLEQRFGFSVPIEELNIEDFRCIAKIARLVARQTANSQN